MDTRGRLAALFNNELFIVTLLFIIALAMRLLGISYQSIGLDEGSTFYYSHYTWDQFVDAHEPNSPIYYMMEGYVIDILGANEFGIRFTSAVSGALVIPLAYLLTKRLLGNYTISLLTAVIFMISPSCLYYSQEARAFSIVLFLFLCQAHILLSALRSNRKIWWLLLSIVSAVSFAMQFVSFIATFTLFSYAIFYYREDLKNRNYARFIIIAVSAVLFLILSLPLMKYAFDSFLAHSSTGPKNMCIGPIYLAVMIYWNLFRSAVFGVIICILVFFGAKYCYGHNREAAYFLLFVCIVPLTITGMLSYISDVYPRYILWSLPGYYTLAACCVLKGGPDPDSIKRYAKKGAVILLAACVVCLPYYYIHICKEDFRGGSNALEENIQPGDAVIYSPNWENGVYACMSFYIDTDDSGVTYIGAGTQAEVEAVRNDPSYNNVYILIYDSQDPYKWVSGLPETECEHIYHAYMMDVYRFV